MLNDDPKSRCMCLLLLLQTLTCVAFNDECIDPTRQNAFASQILNKPVLRALQTTARALAEMRSSKNIERSKAVHKNVNRFLSRMFAIIGSMLVLSHTFTMVFCLIEHYCVIHCLHTLLSKPIVSLSGWLTVFDRLASLASITCDISNTHLLQETSTFCTALPLTYDPFMSRESLWHQYQETYNDWIHTTCPIIWHGTCPMTLRPRNDRSTVDITTTSRDPKHGDDRCNDHRAKDDTKNHHPSSGDLTHRCPQVDSSSNLPLHAVELNSDEFLYGQTLETEVFDREYPYIPIMQLQAADQAFLSDQQESEVENGEKLQSSRPPRSRLIDERTSPLDYCPGGALHWDLNTGLATKMPAAFKHHLKDKAIQRVLASCVAKDTECRSIYPMLYDSGCGKTQIPVYMQSLLDDVHEIDPITFDTASQSTVTCRLVGTLRFTVTGVHEII